jgi:uncharacterized protein (TIGR02284 family)
MASDTASILNDLVTITADSAEGYKHAADDAKDPGLKSLFSDLSSQRTGMMKELQQLVSQHGGSPNTSGTWAGSAHRVFVNLKSVVTGNDRDAILREVERGESTAVAEFEKALNNKDLPAELRTRIQGFLQRFQADRDRWSRMQRAS